MAFEIVAASRAEEAKTTPWRHAIRTGLALGGVERVHGGRSAS